MTTPNDVLKQVLTEEEREARKQIAWDVGKGCCVSSHHWRVVDNCLDRLATLAARVPEYKKLFQLLGNDYNHPWPNEDAGTKQYREGMFAQIRAALSSPPPEAPGVSSTSEITNEQVEKLLSVLKTRDDIETLTNQQLVAKVLDTKHADSLFVLELMNRVDPGWYKRPLPDEAPGATEAAGGVVPDDVEGCQQLTAAHAELAKARDEIDEARRDECKATGMWDETAKELAKVKAELPQRFASALGMPLDTPVAAITQRISEWHMEREVMAAEREAERAVVEAAKAWHKAYRWMSPYWKQSEAESRLFSVMDVYRRELGELDTLTTREDAGKEKKNDND